MWNLKNKQTPPKSEKKRSGLSLPEVGGGRWGNRMKVVDRYTPAVISHGVLEM